MRVECYDLHLYCSNTDIEIEENQTPVECAVPLYNRGPGMFTGYNKTAAYAEARAHGWEIGKRFDFCPACVKAKRTEKHWPK